MEIIIHPPSREVFEAKISTFCTKVWVKKIMRAWDICGEVHIKKRADGSFYYNHPRTAAWILIQIAGIRNPRMIILALTHDTGEERENPFTSEDIDREYNDPVITNGHRAITKLPGQHPREYAAQVFAGGIRLVIVKFCDRLHNHWTLEACDFNKQNRIIMDTLMYYNADTGDYRKFLLKATREERATVDLLWNLIVKAIDDLLAKR